MSLDLSFAATVWKHAGPSSWYFVTVPQGLSRLVRETNKLSESGWGRLHVVAVINGHTWSTAMWFDTKHRSYLLPIKADVRRKTRIDAGSKVVVNIMLCDLAP
jgi:hypothetical protein